MAQRAELPDWRQLLEAGQQFNAVTRAEAQRRAKRLVREGQLAQERMQAFVEGLVLQSRKRAEEFREAVRKEMERQFSVLGLATKRDIARLEARIRKAEKSGGGKRAAKKAKKAAKKAPAGKKAAARKPARS
jgi:polyhydroxyalkanoate synthesis regulator phasin